MAVKRNWLIESCAICTKLKFQSVKNMSNLCLTFCYSCFVAIIQGYHLSDRSLCNLSFCISTKKFELKICQLSNSWIPTGLGLRASSHKQGSKSCSSPLSFLVLDIAFPKDPFPTSTLLCLQ